MEDAIPATEQPASESTAEQNHVLVPLGLTPEEFEDLKPAMAEFHNYRVNAGQCSSILAQRVYAPPQDVWSIVCHFDNPQTYKHFIKSCTVREGFAARVGELRDVSVVSGLPAATSTECLDILDDERCVTDFSIVGGTPIFFAEPHSERDC